MPTEVRIPQLSLTMTEGRISRWFHQQGDTVAQGEALYELETDKVVTEVNAPASGTLAGVAVAEGESAPVLSVIAYVLAAGEAIPDAKDSPTSATPSPKPIQAASESATTAPTVGDRRLFVSPRARKLAEAEGVDVERLPGTGPGGRIMEKDVLKAIADRGAAPAAAVMIPPPDARPTPRPAASVGVPLGGMRAAIARHMKDSQASTAAVTLTSEIDFGEAAKLRAQANVEWGRRGFGKLGYTDIIVRAVARSLADHPRMNSSLREGPNGPELIAHPNINVGVAVALTDEGREGLIVPVIARADQLTLLEISNAVKSLTERARNNQLMPADVAGGTFTITNMGMLGVETFTPIINSPECAILGVGRIADRPVVRDGTVVVRPTAWFSLTFDHRIVDGAPAAVFLGRIRELIESPYLLFV